MKHCDLGAVFCSAKYSQTLDFEEKTFAVEQIGNEDPECCAPKTLEKLFPVTVLETHLPAEGKVETQQRMAHVDKDRVHSCKQVHGIRTD